MTKTLKTSPITSATVARKSAEARLRELLAKFAPAHQRLIGSLRRSLRKRLPTTHELVYEYGNLNVVVISFSPTRRGNEGVLGIRVSAEGVRLYFNRGKELPDPGKLLQGSAQARWIPVESTSDLAQPAVVCLIAKAIAHNRVPFARTGRSQLVINSKS